MTGTSVRFTAVGEGTFVCDPEEQPDVPPPQRPWDGFGGRIAVGSGRLRCEIPGCVGRGDRFKVMLDRPSRCGDVGATVFYGRIRFYTTRAYANLTYPIRRGAPLFGRPPAVPLDADHRRVVRLHRRDTALAGVVQRIVMRPRAARAGSVRAPHRACA